jgi:hypothetical protein
MFITGFFILDEWDPGEAGMSILLLLMFLGIPTLAILGLCRKWRQAPEKIHRLELQRDVYFEGIQKYQDRLQPPVISDTIALQTPLSEKVDSRVTGRFCLFCGHEFTGSPKFCEICGKSVE